jgi:hypothetical protein
MKSILDLFDITKNEISVTNSHNERLSRSYRYLPQNCENDIPVIRHPKENTREFQNDIQEVLRCHNNPCMNTSFLKGSDDSVEDIFKSFCKENGYKNIDWKKINDIIEDVDSVVLKLKYKNNRPRPINYIKDYDETLSAKYKKSPSFPSGHTTIAYFLCDILSQTIPELRQDLQTLASLIGQSRIENAVHFPTDVEYGRLVGETLADMFNSSDEYKLNKEISKKNYKSFGNKLKSQNPDYKKTCKDLAEFIYKTNRIENFNVDPYACFEAARCLVSGINPEGVINCDHINSQCRSLVMANNLGKIDNNHKVACIHKCFSKNVLEKGHPGEFRNYSHSSPSGCHYPEPYDLSEKLKKCHEYSDRPWLRHVLYEYVHPFCDGNGRSGRIILASDCDFDFEKVNSMIDDRYIDNIVAHMQPDKINKLL